MNREELKKELEEIVRNNGPRTLKYSNRKIKVLFEEILDNTLFLEENCRIAERVYCILNDIRHLPECENPECHDVAKFNNFGNGYNKVCSRKCLNKSDRVKELKKKVCLEKYGVENPFQIEEVKRKIQDTLIEKYGVSSPLQSEDIKNKIRETCINRYGLEWASKSEEVKDIVRQGNLKKYGYPSVLQVPEIKEKIKRTNIEKYGHPSATTSEEVKEKTKQTNIERRGVEYPTQCSEVKEKVRQTMLENGTGTVSFCPNIGLNEQQLLDKYEKDNNCKLDRNFRVGIYYPDGYDQENNRIVEIYERRHLNKKRKEYDIQRQQYMQEKLGCEFVIIWDNTH